mmetsp:Transcript_24520/g.37535  ORF Transcript_24520/g.37535 Transcript_24520/m.37535 type:complete len:92 (-) Transcript_24520:695-970(-)
MFLSLYAFLCMLHGYPSCEIDIRGEENDDGGEEYNHAKKSDAVRFRSSNSPMISTRCGSTYVCDEVVILVRIVYGNMYSPCNLLVRHCCSS